MAKKEINIFSVSLLDLLSGALGAVIILYVVIDKNPYKTSGGFEKELLSCDSTVDKGLEGLEASIELIRNDLPADEYRNLKDQLENVKNDLTCFRQIIDEQQEVIINLNDQLQNARDSIASLQEQLSTTKEALSNCQAEKDQLEQKVTQLQETLNKVTQERDHYKKQYEDCVKENNKKVVGFELTNRTVFVVDVSGSMKDDGKIGDVKAGMKMLIATMNQEYAVDLVYFPNGSVSDYGFSYGQLTSVTQSTKYELYNFIERLRPDGGTPTESAMNYVLRNYPQATTIVLLSDGEPDDVTTYSQASAMVSRISSRNANGVTINTIGVGRDFRSASQSVKKTFLKDIATRNDGFFEGF